MVTCSALKRGYRDTLRSYCPEAFFLHLTGSDALVQDRLAHRGGHFMKVDMLRSQLAILEPLGADENGAVLDVGPAPDTLVENAAALFRPVAPVTPPHVNAHPHVNGDLA